MRKDDGVRAQTRPAHGGSRDKLTTATAAAAAMRGDGKAGVKFSTPEDYKGVRRGGVGGGGGGGGVGSGVGHI